MPSVTPSSDPLSAFEGLVNLERSRAFHAGRRAVGLATMEALVEALVGASAGASAERAPWAGASGPALCVHVAGSEGKTSVSERVAAGLAAAGLTVGTYTSPHLRHPAERLRLAGALPTPEQLRPAVEAVCAAAEGAGLSPSWFEALTATALVLFSRQGVEAAVWETGLGGRLDATRVLPARLCVLTTISLEHTAVLGDSLAAVAREKAGILRPGLPLVCGRWLPEEARAVVLEEARRLGCPVHQVPEAAGPWERNRALAHEVLEVLARTGALDPARLPAARAAVEEHRVEGRDDLRADVLYDGAHTVAAARALAERLAGAPRGPIVLGVTSGRDAVAMAAALLPVAAPLILTRAPGERGLDPTEIAEGLAARGVDASGATGQGLLLEPDPQRALERARALAAGRERPSRGAVRKPGITVTGSLHLVGLLLPPRSEDSSP